MTEGTPGFSRSETDASLHAERKNTDTELAHRVAAADIDADEVLRRDRERADRLLGAVRAAADARLPLGEQTKATVALLLSRRSQEDREIASERACADDLLDRDRRDRQEKLSMLLMLERQATDLHLALERRSADTTVAARDDFLAQVSHDLKGLLGAHKLYLALLIKEAEGELASRLSAMQQISSEMERLVSDLLDMAAVEMRQLAVAPRPQSAAELLSMTSAVFGPVVRERGQSLKVASSSADANVMADPTRALQVLGNLVSNAIKFSQPDGDIRIGFEVFDHAVGFFVADSGPGVPAEHKARIFERGASFGRGSKGLGLGLFIARCLAEAHGGRLWLDEDVTAGAMFHFTLPRVH